MPKDKQTVVLFKPVRHSSAYTSEDANPTEKVPERVTRAQIINTNVIKYELDLAKCPFCGSSAKLIEGGNGLWPSYNVYCHNCGASSGSRNTAKKAIALWNNRKQRKPRAVSVSCKRDSLANKFKKDLDGQLFFDFIN